MTQNIIPLVVEGGCGDNAIALNLLNVLRKTIGENNQYMIYSRYPELLKTFVGWAVVKNFSEWEQEKALLPWSIMVSDICTFIIKSKSLLMPPSVVAMFNHWLELIKSYGYLFEKFPHTVNLLSQLALRSGYNRYTFPFHCLGLSYDTTFELTWSRPAVAPARYITVNDGFAKHHEIKKATKNWYADSWKLALFAIKQKYPDIVIVQVGDKRSAPLDFIDLQLSGKTSFKEMIGWLAHADIHVGNDSGPVHVRHLFKKPSVVLYGPTPSRYFGYPENINLEGSACHNCWWDKADWNEHCPFTFDKCYRMLSILPAHVVQAVDKLLLVSGQNKKHRKTKKDCYNKEQLNQEK